MPCFIFALFCSFSRFDYYMGEAWPDALSDSRYSPEQLFDVVAAVDLYHGFVPWCQRSDIIKTFPDGSFDAELEIGFKFLVESYVSHVELERAKRIKAIIFLQVSYDSFYKFSSALVCSLFYLLTDNLLYCNGSQVIFSDLYNFEIKIPESYKCDRM